MKNANIPGKTAMINSNIDVTSPLSFIQKAVNPRILELTAFSDVPCGNRTHNWGLGGSCYIHLTKGTSTTDKEKPIPDN